jgi:hypothetical protein
MKTKSVALAAAISVMSLAGVPALAHHSFSAEFDVNKPITLKGTVTKMEWMNPHIWFYIDVTDESGAVQHWQLEGGPPNNLTRNGWRKDSLKPGDQVTVEGFRARNASNTANARLVTLPDDKKVFSGSADDGGPGSKGPTQ